MKYTEISIDNSDSFQAILHDLSFAAHASLSMYWRICEEKGTNARLFVDLFPCTNQVFLRKNHLGYRFKKYKENRWVWVQTIMAHLERNGFITIENLADDYFLRPRVSCIFFKFNQQMSHLQVLRDVVEVHKFLSRFVPNKYSQPKRRHRKKSKRKKTSPSFEDLIAKRNVEIDFPIYYSSLVVRIKPKVDVSSEDSKSKDATLAFSLEESAKLLSNSGQYSEAIDKFRQASLIWQKLGNNYQYTLCLANCSICNAKEFFNKQHASSQDFKDAKNFFERAAEQFRTIEHISADWALAHVFECDYRIAKKERDLELMIAALEKAVVYYEHTNDKLGLFANQGDLAKYQGTLLIRQKDYQLASKAFLSSEKFYREATTWASKDKDKGRFEMDALNASALFEFSEADEALTKHLLNTEDVGYKYEDASSKFAESKNFRSSILSKQLAQLLRDILAKNADQVKKTLLSLSFGKIDLPAHERDRLNSIKLLAQDFDANTSVPSEMDILVKALDITNANITNDVMERPTDLDEVLIENKIYKINYELMELLSNCNEICTSQTKEPIFKTTSTMVGKLGAMGSPIKNSADFGNLIDALFQIVYEGSSETKRIPEEFKKDSFICFTIKFLRHDLRHDLEQTSDEKEAARKKARVAKIFGRYTGKTTLSALKPEDFLKIQLKLLGELRIFLEDLKQYCIDH